MKTLIELGINLEGKLTLDGREVWKAAPIGRPRAFEYDMFISDSIVDSAPSNANAYVKGSAEGISNSEKRVPVQYYNLDTAPQGPGTD